MNKSIQGNANGIVDQAKQTVANVASDAKAGVQTQLEQKIDAAKGIGIEKIETVSEALRGAGEKLEGTGPLPQLANKAAEGIENLVNYVENKDIGDLFRGVETFARREPALFLGGAVALGLLAGRFLKSSARATSSQYAYSGSGGDIDPYETLGYEGEYSSEGDYLSADDLEDEWDSGANTQEEPMAFQSESNGIGMSSSPSYSSQVNETLSSTPSKTSTSNTSSFDSRATQPQGSSFGGASVSTKGNTEKMPVTQGTGSEDKKSDDFSSFNKSSR